MDTQRSNHRRPIPANGLLLVVAAMLGVLILDRIDERALRGHGSVAMASSQPEATGSLISAADQRKQIIAEVRAISQRLASMEQRLAKPIQVKVIEMPMQKEKPVPAGN